MLSNLLWSILPILSALVLGWCCGKKIPEYVSRRLIFGIHYLVWALLFFIGFSFGEILVDPHIGYMLILKALMYSSAICLITFASLCMLPNQSQPIKNRSGLSHIWQPIKACLQAMMMVVLGVFCYYYLGHFSLNTDIILSGLLYILIALVGIDLANVKINKISRIYWLPTFASILCLFITAGLGWWLFNANFKELVLIGSGFGWFSLSGSLVGKLLGEELGSLALLIDLFREFYAIIFMFLFGRLYPMSSIAVCGATAMDSTLPFVKNNCSTQHVQIAIFTGLILSLLAPFFIIFFASLIGV